jgi:hypothetical protein
MGARMKQGHAHTLTGTGIAPPTASSSINKTQTSVYPPARRISLLVRATWLVGIIILFRISGPLGPVVRAQCDDVSARPRRALSSGIITTRISRKDKKRWHAIKRIVFAEDDKGQPIHPTLRDLWEKIEHSGHAVYIEMRSPNGNVSTIAGSFHIEQFDPQGIRHVAVIRLNPATIDMAYVGEAVARPNGFIPLLGLNKEERYAEVLGHELAHAVYILSDLKRAQMVEESIQKTNELFLLHLRKHGYSHLKQEIRHRVFRRDILLQELEEQAEAVEELVWQELISAQQ